MTRDETASKLWRDMYLELTTADEQPALYEATTARAEAQVLRLSMIYALLDGRSTIGEQHHRAARAVWDFAAAAARLIFNATPEEPLMTRVQAMLGAAPEGLTRTSFTTPFTATCLPRSWPRCCTNWSGSVWPLRRSSAQDSRGRRRSGGGQYERTIAGATPWSGAGEGI
jgi:hypothetical protein